LTPPTLATRIQHRLSQTYGIEEAPPVDGFIQATTGGNREVLLIRDLGDGVEVALYLPPVATDGNRPSFDEICQIVEGVSHFLYVVERARRELPATQLELELQAEVDKYVVLVHGGLSGQAMRFERSRAARIRDRLFGSATFLHPKGTETGDRYRMANDLAARFAERLEDTFARHGNFERMRAALRRFYAAGQAEKIMLAQAA
jgi:hypothetical protein